MFIDPYSTTIMKHYRADKLRKNIRMVMLDRDQRIVRKASFQGNECKNVWWVTHADGNQEIDHFTQPIVLGDACVVIDARPFIASERSGDVVIRAQSELELLVVRGLFTIEYLNGNSTSVINGLMSTSWRLFDRVVTSTLVNSLNLRSDFEAQSRISIFTAIYWMGLFYNNPEDLNNTPEQTVLQLTRMTPHYPNEIESVFGISGAITDITDFCEKLPRAVTNPRLEGMDFKTFYPMINKQWWGVNASEMLGVAMEHVPTFLALIYMSLTSRNYKRTAIYQRVTDFKDRKVKTTLEETLYRVAMAGCI